VGSAIIQGNREDIVGFVKQAVDSGIGAQELVNQIMIPAITKVGELFDRKEYFLPQLIASAETMKKGFGFLEPLLREQSDEAKKKTVVILATVEGDIHDIGKNIVALLLRNHGFDVVDLGADVSTQKIVNEIKKHKEPIVGLSALMTTTMVNMKKVIDVAREEKINCRFIVGGAVVTSAYAQSLGVQYAKDGVAAVRVAQGCSNGGVKA
jgi:5-methyltetrahydrofolate--homocysteine methyltransferase